MLWAAFEGDALKGGSLFVGAGKLLAASLATLFISGEPFAQSRPPLVESIDVQVPIAPTPVNIGGKVHLAYELRIANFQRADITLSRIQVTRQDRPDAVLADYREPDIEKRLGRPGVRRGSADLRLLGAGAHAVVYFWIAMNEGDTVPTALSHRIELDVMRPAGAVRSVVKEYLVGVRQEPAAVLNPPLRGGPWVAIYDPLMIGGHRTAIYTIDGRARIPARFAIDWVKLPASGVFQGSAKPAEPGWNGDGEEVLAVADGVVAAAVDDMPDNDDPRGAPPARHTLENASGNYVALDLGRGRFVFYEHLKRGSIAVKAGDRVKSGQVVGRLGNSGSSSIGPHLHFHVSDANSTLGAEGLPFVFAGFNQFGTFRSIDAFVNGEKWQPDAAGQRKERKLEMPAANSVVEFR